MLAAGAQAQAKVIGDQRLAIAFLTTLREAMLHSLRTEALQGPILSTSQQVVDYLFADMAHARVERFRVLFLDARNRLLRDEVMGEGSINEAPIYPREIMRRALEVGASALILAHNHPSGDPQPSRKDIRTTARIAEAGRTLGIAIHDHLILSKGGWTTFRMLGLLDREAR